MVDSMCARIYTEYYIYLITLVLNEIMNFGEIMAIALNGNNLHKQDYINEDELQGYIFMYPFLIQNETDSTYYKLAREVHLPSSGIIDMMFLEENGTLVAVEVKLSRNSQSRREVVAQIFDYIADISSLRYHDLDEVLKGVLQDVCSEIDEGGDLPKVINSFLKSGNIKVIIAVDQVNTGLVRIMQFINDRTDLDVRLVEISKFDEGKILVPKIIIEGKISDANRDDLYSDNIFDEVIKTYNSIACEELKTKNNATNFRQIRLLDWPTTVHYEFVLKIRKGEIGVEFHIESDQYLSLRKVLESFAGEMIHNNEEIKFDQKWSKGRGRLLIILPKSTNQEIIAKCMIEFIELTKDKLTNEIDRIRNQ